ncbi:hypothetical protein [Ralstonia solanacearum]|uniref:hypothetical protein n=1 Tax=Ralstonia solanacearum TaxID=305 RepID=UPI002305BDD7|nr:hypothetical protein [Ralstonia solanacearum]MDB0510981.1 hypothetical protein [Ralstonia solanacearum]
MDVHLQTIPSVAIALLNGGALVGTITGANIPQMTRCLQNGFRYSATVIAISGGNWTVEVKHA